MPAKKCDACGADIRFERNEAGKWQVISIATGKSHFLDCTDPNRFSGRNRKATS